MADPGTLGAPRQAELRRAVSTAYYALFHRLISEAGRSLAGASPEWEVLRVAVYGRAFQHGDMRKVAVQFKEGNPRKVYRRAMGDAPPGPELRSIAATFTRLQTERHKADYDIEARFTRSDVIKLVDEVEDAFATLAIVRGRLETDVFLAALLLGDRIRE